MEEKVTMGFSVLDRFLLHFADAITNKSNKQARVYARILKTLRVSEAEQFEVGIKYVLTGFTIIEPENAEAIFGQARQRRQPFDLTLEEVKALYDLVCCVDRWPGHLTEDSIALEDGLKALLDSAEVKRKLTELPRRERARIARDLVREMDGSGGKEKGEV